MSEIKYFYLLLKSEYIAYGISIAIFLTVSNESAYAADSQVIIANSTAHHCLPYLSCYKPYEIDIKPGDTVTWVNNDNRTHTATAGTPNYGPVGMFDSGPIQPGRTYTQFFGTVGKYPYYDQTDMWPSGIVVVSNKGPTRAEIGWINGSLSLTSQGNNDSQQLVLTKQIQNMGGIDADSVLFRLRILNDTGFLFYDKTVSGSIPAKQNATVSFTWENPALGKYHLNFNAVNPAKQTNENNEFSSDLISISKSNSSQLKPIITGNYTIYNENMTIPEFDTMSLVILLVSIMVVMVVSARVRLISKT